MKKFRLFLLPFLMAAGLTLTACGSSAADSSRPAEVTAESTHAKSSSSSAKSSKSSAPSHKKKSTSKSKGSSSSGSKKSRTSSGSVSLSDIPAFSGDPYVTVNNNKPVFSSKLLKQARHSFEHYRSLDSEGRCQTATASIDTDLMPTEKRGAIGSVRPSGWHTVKYDNVDGRYLYNRCHLIGYQLTAENANERNLITGTRYLNVDGMLPFENMVTDYIKETHNHVLYRVTPVFKGDNEVASGVQMEGYSVEDNGKGICYNVYCYNNQPGISIDYATGDSRQVSSETAESSSKSSSSGSRSRSGYSSSSKNRSSKKSHSSARAHSTRSSSSSKSGQTTAAKQTYVLNTNTMKFHRPDCHSAKITSSQNKRVVHTTRSHLIQEGYDPCKNCNP